MKKFMMHKLTKKKKNSTMKQKLSSKFFQTEPIKNQFSRQDSNLDQWIQSPLYYPYTTEDLACFYYKFINNILF
jgi:hypothetical protein